MPEKPKFDSSGKPISELICLEIENDHSNVDPQSYSIKSE